MLKMKRRTSLLAALLCLSLSGFMSCSPAGTSSSSTAPATVLTDTDPAANATVTAPVPMVHVIFNSKVDPKASGLEITTADGSKVDMGEIMPMSDTILMATPKTPLPAGQYTVKWHAVGADSKPLQGQFAFTVQ